MSIDRRYQGSNSRLLGLSAMVIIMWGVTAWLREVAAALPPLELTGLAMSAAAASASRRCDTCVS